MVEPPKLNYHLTTAEELARLYREHGFDEKLPNCRQLSFPEPQGPYHETFCCKRELTRHIDSDNIEIAVIIYQTDAHGDESKNQRRIRRLRIGSDVYILRPI